MKPRITSFLLFLLIATIGISQEKEPEKENDKWEIYFTPYALIASQSTDVGGQKIRQSFGDLASLTNAGFQIITTARYKRLFLTFDGTFATLGGNITSTGDLMSYDVDLTIKQRILDFKLSYMVYNNFEIKGSDVIKGWSLEFAGGVKYWQNDVIIDYTLTAHNPLPGKDDKIVQDSEIIPQKWFDLMLGGQADFILSDKVKLVVGFNVGGFGIGNSSKFAYDFTYINSFRVLKWLSVDVGFRNFYYNRVDGEGVDELTTKVKVIGPILGVTFDL